MAKILVVDDESMAVELIKLILEKDGHEVIPAYNGQEAVQAMGIDPPNPAAPLPDLVLLDIMMPVMDGHAVCLMMSGDPRTRGIPIIVVTAKGEMRHLFETMPSVAAFFSKPFDPKTLRQTVAQVLVRK